MAVLSRAVTGGQPEAADELLGSLLRTQKIVWVAFVTSLALYAFCAWVITNAANAPRVLDAHTLLPFLAVTLVNLAVWASLRRRFFSETTLREVASREYCPETLAVAAGAQNDSSLFERISSLAEADLRRLGLTRWVTERLIILWALCECPVIVGLVLAMLSARFEPLVPFLLVSLAMLSASRPQTDTIVARALAWPPSS